MLVDVDVQNNPDQAVELITEFCEDNASHVLKQWWELADTLVAKYSDGYINLPAEEGTKKIGYPSTWLSYTNYKKGPTSYDMKP